MDLSFFGVMPEFPGRHFFERHVPGAADLEQGVARDRVEGLDAAVEQHGQPAKFADVILPVLLGQHHGDDLGAEQGEEEPGDELEQEFHAVLRLKAKPSRWVANWTTKPSPTSTQEK